MMARAAARGICAQRVAVPETRHEEDIMAVITLSSRQARKQVSVKDRVSEAEW